VISFAAVSLLSTGCHHVFGMKKADVFLWRLDADRGIRLTVMESTYPIWADDEMTYTHVYLDRIEGHHLVGNGVTLRYRSGWQRRKVGPLRHGVLEARSDNDRTKVWIIDTDQKRVFATINFQTGETSCRYKETPNWATVDSGILLERVIPQEANQSRTAK
jgi:hypothetical protein